MPSPETKPGLTSPSWARLMRKEVGLSPIGPVIGTALGGALGAGIVFVPEWVVQTAFIPNEDTRSFFLAWVGTPTKVAVGFLGGVVGGALGIRS